jgi:glutathione peroxidase
MKGAPMPNLYDFDVEKADGTRQSLADYRGKVVLIVNTASKCGFTSQYSGLEKLYQRYRDKGVEVLGFPCDQFLHQEPAGNSEIQSFCKLNFGVTFPVFAKIKVNGSDRHPLYAYLSNAASGVFGTSTIKWNFTKFLIDRTGRVVKRYAPTTKPEKIVDDIVKLLITPNTVR